MIPKILVLSFLVHSIDAQCRQQSHKYIGDLCYVLSDQQLDFQDALNSCHQTSTQLAVIHTSTQANFLASLMGKQSRNNQFWIGLSRQSVNSKFQWDDGTNMYFSNFDSNMPDNNLYVAESTVNGKWRTLDGQEHLPFVCSYDPKVIPCTPQSNHTFLFAYSNDLDPQVVKNSILKIVNDWEVRGNFSKFGSVRFDTKNPGSFQFFEDLRSLNQSVYLNLPDPSLGFSNDQEGSDILNVLKRFLESEVDLCGSQVFILLKRHPRETDTSELLAQLQKNHVFINSVISNTAILQGNYKVMYNLSGRTNGLAGFVNDLFMNWIVYEFSYVMDYPIQIYSINPIVKSGIERTDLPILRIPPNPSSSEKIFPYFEVSIQDHGPLDKFRSFNLTLTNVLDPTDQNKASLDTPFLGSTFIYPGFELLPNTNYSVKLLTEYSDSVPENLQLRVWIFDAPINYWLPFTNWN